METSLEESQTGSYFPTKWPNGYPKQKDVSDTHIQRRTITKINHDRRTALERSVKSISLFSYYLYQTEFVQIRHRVRRKSSSFWYCECFSSIWPNSREFIRGMFLLSICATEKIYINFDKKKQSPKVLENQTRLQNSAYTTRRGLIYSVLYALSEQIQSGINRDILKKSYLTRS